MEITRQFFTDSFFDIMSALYPTLETLDWLSNDVNFDWIVVWQTSNGVLMPDIQTVFDLLQDQTSKEYKAVFAALEPDYRQKRAAEYIAKLSPEGTFETSVFDLLNAVIKAIIYDDTTELLASVDIIENIKDTHPKPQKLK